MGERKKGEGKGRRKPTRGVSTNACRRVSTNARDRAASLGRREREEKGLSTSLIFQLTQSCVCNLDGKSQIKNTENGAARAAGETFVGHIADINGKVKI